MSFSSSRRNFMRTGLGTAIVASRTGWFAADSVAKAVPQAQWHHPLDALNAEEIELTARILQQSGKVHPETRFGLLELQEPPKAQVRSDLVNGTVHRAAYIMLYDWSTATGWEMVVDLTTRRVASETLLDSREPPCFWLAFDPD